MAERFTKFDGAEHLRTEEDVQAYLEACAEEAGDDPAVLVHALATVARARNMTQLAERAGITRQGLYKALAEDGNPSFVNVAKIAGAMGLRFSFVIKEDAPARHHGGDPSN